MKNKYFFLFFCIALAGMVGGVLLYKHFTQQKVIHFHAGFQVYIDDKLQDYSAQKYMSLLPCGKAYADPALEQAEKAHLHNQVGDVVHVHRVGATWGDLFKNMRVSFPSSKAITGYINGKQVGDVLHQQIHPYDRAILLIGSNGSTHTYLQQQVPISHILKIEKGSFEGCGTSPE
jgi:hypothetical protein